MWLKKHTRVGIVAQLQQWRWAKLPHVSVSSDDNCRSTVEYHWVHGPRHSNWTLGWIHDFRCRRSCRKSCPSRLGDCNGLVSKLWPRIIVLYPSWLGWIYGANVNSYDGITRSCLGCILWANNIYYKGITRLRQSKIGCDSLAFKGSYKTCITWERPPTEQCTWSWQNLSSCKRLQYNK